MRKPSAHRHVSDIELTDDESVEDLLDLVLPPLHSEAVLMFMPASGSRSDTGTICLVDDVPVRSRPDLAVKAMETAAHSAVSLTDCAPSLLVAFHRRGETDPRESDVLWVDAARAACRDHDVRLLGVWLRVGRGRARRLDAVPAAASERPRPGSPSRNT